MAIYYKEHLNVDVGDDFVNTAIIEQAKIRQRK